MILWYIMLMDNNKKNNTQSLKPAVLALLFVASIAIIGLGDYQNIYYIKTLGYMAAGFSGAIFSKYFVGNSKEPIFNSWKSFILLIISLLILAIPITLLFEGRLW